MRERLLAPVAALLLLPAVLAGCGGSSNESSSPADWAQSFCSSLGTWKSSVTAAGKTLANTSDLSKNTAQQAVNSITSANQKLVDDLKALGKPSGANGSQAKDDVDELSNQLQNDADKLKNDMKGVSNAQELLTAVSAMAQVGASAASSASSTITNLKSLSKDWQQAFENSEACKSLKQG